MPSDARLSTNIVPLQKADISNTAGSLTAQSPTTTRPLKSSTVALIYDTSLVDQFVSQSPTLVQLIPFAAGTAMTSVLVRVTGWKRYRNTSGTDWYVPMTLFDGGLQYPTTAANATTFGSGQPDGTQLYLFAGVTTNAWAPAPNLYAPANALAANVGVASLTIDCNGCEVVTAQIAAGGTLAATGFFWSVL